MRLTAKQLQTLNQIGVLGYGQTFSILSKCDGTEEHAITDTIPCSVVDKQGEIIPNQIALNPYTSKPEPAIKMGYYVYEIETRVDSSD